MVKVNWTFAVPSYRFDISIEVDLIEELARVYGYNNLPVKVPTAELNMIADDESQLTLQRCTSSAGCSWLSGSDYLQLH